MVFGHGQLRLYLLALLEEGPRHGYEIITALADRFGGTYRPSPGTVYPRLARLEQEGLVRRIDEGRRTTYEITDAGRAELAARGGDLTDLEHEIAESVRMMAAEVRDEVRGSMEGLRADLAAAAQEARAGARSARSQAEQSATRGRDRARRAEAEALLTQFRAELKAELRQAEAAGRVTDLTVTTLRTVLDSARAAVRATL